MRIRNRSGGAVLISFAIVFPVLLTMTFLIIFAGVAYFRYQLLLYSMSVKARELALNVQSSQASEEQWENWAAGEINAFLHQSFGIPIGTGAGMASATVDVKPVENPDAAVRCTLRAMAQWDMSNLTFGYSLFPISMHARAAFIIEDPCFTHDCT